LRRFAGYSASVFPSQSHLQQPGKTDICEKSAFQRTALVDAPILIGASIGSRFGKRVFLESKRIKMGEAR